MIKDVTFTSIWDGGINITTKCKVNLETKEVFDIEMSDTCEKLNIFDAEYITVDGVDYPVSNDSTTEFWYR